MDPTGCSNPMIYFLSYNNNRSGIIGDTNSYDSDTMFRAMIGAVGLNDNNCRFYSIYADQNTRNNFIEDILVSKPKVLVLLGSDVIKEFGIKGGINNTRGTVINCSGIATIPTFHPIFIASSEDPSVRMSFKSDIKLAMDLAVDDSLRLARLSGDDPSKSNHTSSTVLCKTYEEFDEFCINYIDNADQIAYDVETNAREVHSIDHRIVGFSLAPNKDIGCYLPLDALDYHFSSYDKIRVKERMRKIIKKDVIVYNCQHEYPVTYNWLNTNMGHTDDVFVMVKLMYSSTADKFQGHRGLKEQSVTHLHYKDWSADLDTYFNYVTHYDQNRDNMRSLLAKYYEQSELDHLMSTVDDFVERVLPTIPKGQVISYEYVPYKLIGRYGSVDSSVLFELKNFYDDWMDREGAELGIDLHRGYEYWMRHHYCGYVLEKNGAYWNDEKADSLEQWCITGMHDKIKALVQSPLSADYIKKTTYNIFLSYLKENYLDKILGSDYTPKRKYKTSIDVVCNNPDAEQRLRNMSLLPKVAKNGTKTYKLEDGHIEYMAKSLLDSNPDLYENWFKEFMREYIEQDRTIDEYKSLINPGAVSQEWKDFVSGVLITDEIRVAKFYTNIVKMIEEPGFDIDYYKDFYNDRLEDIDNNPKMTWKFDIAQFKREHPEYSYIDTDDSNLISLVEMLKNNEDLTKSRRFNMFQKGLVGLSLKSKKMKRSLSDAQSYRLTSLDGDSTFEVYELWEMLGMDIEDPSTWNDRFEWLVNYKLFKKYNKVISTYIKGKTGRANVYYVDKESYTRGDYFTRREKMYDGGTYEGKVTMMQQDFRVNAADTGRWKAGMHNIPAGESVKGMFTSRFKGGCIMMPDGAQMEVRLMACEAGEENLFKAFEEGLDIHKFFASKIYSVPYEEVEKWQRGLAKNAVFGILYGMNPQSFADSYLHGDLTQALKIYDDMFSAFPKIKDYVDRAHNQFETYHKVTTLTQRFLRLDETQGTNHNTLLRQSQNYPIQADAEDLAGLIMYEFVKWIEDNDMKSKVFCFIHDSIEIDVHPDEVFQCIEKFNYLFNVYPRETFGAPVECDVPLGPSMGQECATSDMVHDDEFNDVILTLEGYIEEIEEVLNSWREVYSLVEVLPDFQDEDKDDYIPMSKTFLPKKAPMSIFAGQYRKKGKRRIHVIRKM